MTQLLGEHQVEDAAAVAARFTLLADPLRMQIIQLLTREQLCTCHLVDLTGARQTTISHHLRLLREAGVVVGEAEGRFTWYRLAPGAFGDALRRLTEIDGAVDTQRLRPACSPQP